MAFPGSTYAPPGVYTQTLFENPIAGQIDLLRIPVFIGEGSELIPQSNLEIIRGSSSSVDQQVYLEDETGRAVTSTLADGTLVLGDFDGSLTQLQVRNYPIVTGKGSGTTTNDRSSVQVRINNQPIVVRSVTGATGLIELAQAPKVGDTVQVTYFFNRTDTLITDTVSSQVTDDKAKVYAQSGILDISVGGTDTFSIIEDSNDTFLLSIDGEDYSITIPEIGSGYTVQNMITLINTAVTGSSLVASAFTNNQGKRAILLSADQEITIGDGTANGTIGIVGGTSTSRNKVFYTNQGPIVDGTNGGVTTTDVSDVTVKVDGVQVIPSEVNGKTRAVTLPVAPKQGAIVTIQYYFNTWQDTFDYLANINISSVTQCGRTANQNDFIDGADFILKNDKIVWGTSALASAGTTTGSVAFDDSQVSLTLIDNQMFMAECSSVTSTSGTVAVTSTTKFRLPYQPTSGNGRNSPLGSSLFQTVTNGRIDLPTNRPDLVKAYWGYNVQDAIERGEISVVSVDSSTSTMELSEEVPVGAKVYATFYYNTLTDSEYVLSSATEGASGSGEYTVTKNGVDFFSALFDITSKSAGLSTITVQFPSGSELSSDVRIENGVPVEETVTVEFASTEASPAKYTVTNSSPYYFVEDKSATAQLKVDGAASLVIDLSDSHSTGFGHNASLVGSEITYDADSASTTVDVDSTNRDLSIDVDGVVISASVNTGAKVVDDFASALNEQAQGANYTLVSGTTTTFELPAGASDVDDYYVGHKVVIQGHAIDASLNNTEITITAYDGTTKEATFAAVAGAFGVGDTVYIYNPNNLPIYKGSSKFLSATKLGTTGEKYTKITIDYQGTTVGALTTTLTLSDGTYASATAIANEINTQIIAGGIFATETSPTAVFDKPMVTAFGDANGRVGFKFRKGATDTGGGVFAFAKDSGTAHDDFCLLAGIDASTSGYNTEGVHIAHAPIATSFTAGGTKDLYDRLILRNRIWCGGFSVSSHASTTAHNALSQCKLEVQSGTANSLCGLSVGDYGSASAGAVVQSATLVGNIGNANQLQSGGGTTQGEAYVTFYDGTGTKAANNIFRITIDGKFTEVTFSASASGTVATIGSGNDHNAQDSSSIIYQIKDAIATDYSSIFGVVGSDTMSKVVRREGFGIRISSLKTDSKSKITIGDGSANSVLGFTDGTISLLTPTTASELASVLMNDVASTGDIFLGQGSDYQANGVSTTATDFPSEAIAYVEEDNAGQQYLAIQSKTTGASSSVVVEDAASNSWLSYGTMIGAVDGDSSIGEDSIDGFFVTSNNSDGSGSANDSVFNDGVGSDGVVGQTYVDSVTGLTFTILARDGGGVYPVGESIAFTSSQTFVTDANYPVMLNGVEMIVSNTLNVPSGDTCVVETFEKGGEQPEIGEPYVVSYLYQKESFETQLFTKMSAIESAMGEISPENPLSLASYLAILNGAVLVALKQVQKAEASSQGSITAYKTALDEVEGKIAGQVDPSVIVPLRTDDSEFLQYLSRHINVQSSIRYKAERTAIVGASAGTDTKTVINLAKAMSNTRFRMVYPDSAIVPVTNAIGDTKEYLVDGAYLSAALVGNRVSPNRDVATPWTNAQLVGFSQLGRILDAVEQNQVSVNGVTVFVDQTPFIKLRHGLTTDMTNVLTKTPTIIQIADEVQKQSRAVLERFVGVKFLPGVLSQVEGRLSQMFIGLVNAQIVAGYTGISASVSADDPTVAEVEAYYSPVFPLLYLVVTFNLRSSV